MNNQVIEKSIVFLKRQVAGQFCRALLKMLLQLVAVAAMAVALVNCGGGGSADSSASDNGQLVVGITDAEGDFLSYEVQVTSIQLQKANGTTVETVPIETRIDFAEYTDMTEFFNIATIPAGVYTGAILRLDYSDARVVIENSVGEAVPATVVDANGDAVAQTELTVQFSGDHPLLIRAGKPANLMVDFDLAASHEVLSYDPASVELDPYIVADVQWQTSREHRARGLLASVDVENNSFALELRPFRQRDHHFGTLAVQVNDDTWYEINGVTYTGSEGLDALAALDVDTPVISFGQVLRTDDAQSYTALRVIAGSSVPWANHDTAAGTVVAREGDVLTLKGRFYDHQTARMLFNSEIKVSIGDDTQFSRQVVSDEGLDKNSVSVGQRVVVVGDAEFTEPEINLDEETAAIIDNRLADSGFDGGRLESFKDREYRNALGEHNFLATRCQLNSVINLDATEGYLRLRLTALLGSVVDTDKLVMDLAAINQRPVSVYDFTGTGSEAANDADPANYQVDTQALSLPELAAGQWLKVLGFVAPFGSAPDDFIAHTVIDPAINPLGADLLMAWPEDSANPFTLINEDEVIVDSSGSRHRVDIYARRWNEQAASYTLLPAADEGVYSIKLQAAQQLMMYRQFADFTAALDDYMSQEGEIARLHAKGRYNVDTGELKAVAISVILR